MKTYFIFDSLESHLKFTKATILFYSYTPSMNNYCCTPNANMI